MLRWLFIFLQFIFEVSVKSFKDIIILSYRLGFFRASIPIFSLSYAVFGYFFYFFSSNFHACMALFFHYKKVLFFVACTFCILGMHFFMLNNYWSLSYNEPLLVKYFRKPISKIFCVWLFSGGVFDYQKRFSLWYYIKILFRIYLVLFPFVLIIIIWSY